jgi:hypothetical protein
MKGRERAPFELGETFLRGHLWVAATLPDKDSNILGLNFTTKNPDSDTSCVIRKGDHPWVEHDTVIEYARPAVWTMAQQQLVLDNRDSCPSRGRVSSSLLARIQKGGLASKFLAPMLKEMIRKSIAKQESDAIEDDLDAGSKVRSKNRW